MAGFRTVAGRVGASALLVTTATLGTVATADAAPAAPTDCRITAYQTGAHVACATGSGQFRAYTRCDVSLWPDYNRYGRWVGVPNFSVALCDEGDRAFNQGFQTR
jgi:hypothetical protein